MLLKIVCQSVLIALATATSVPSYGGAYTHYYDSRFKQVGLAQNNPADQLTASGSHLYSQPFTVPVYVPSNLAYAESASSGYKRASPVVRAAGRRRSAAKRRVAKPLTQSVSYSGADSSAASYQAEPEHPKPEPYQFQYGIDDAVSGSQSRQETGDEYGNIKGSYSYKDPYGIYRTVEYTAGPEGFKAVVHSNEPGLGSTENPADVVYNVEEPPAGSYGTRNQKSALKADYTNNYPVYQ